MNEVKIKLETINGILNYLSNQPFKDVAEIINRLVLEVQEQQKPENEAH